MPRYLLLLPLLFLACADDTTAPDPATPPLVETDGYLVVETGDTIRLDVVVTDDGAVTKHEWFFEGSNGFVETSTASTVTVAPLTPDSAFICVYRATDNDNLSTTDTVLVWVVNDVTAELPRVVRPSGGETYRIGDTLEVELWPLPGGVRIELEIGEYLLGLPGLDAAVEPSTTPVTAFEIPDSLTYNGWTGSGFELIPVSVVSDSCKIHVSDYDQSHVYGQSAGYFGILPAD